MIRGIIRLTYALLKVAYFMSSAVVVLSVATIVELVSRLLFKSGTLDLESLIKYSIQEWYQIDRVIVFREEVVEIIDGYLIEFMDQDDYEKYDSWALKREIIQNKKRSKRKFETAERVTTILGGMTTITATVFINPNYVGILLTILILSLSFLLVGRVIISDLLSYELADVRSDPNHMLIVKSAFNYHTAGIGAFLFLSGILMAFDENNAGREYGLNHFDDLVYYCISNSDRFEYGTKWQNEYPGRIDIEWFLNLGNDIN